MPLRVALLGCGRIARLFHLPILARSPAAALNVVADPDFASRAAARAVAPEATAVDDWRAAVDDPDVDAVVIALPTGLHAEAARAAWAAGKHVYLEKPIAASLEDGAQVVSAWRAGGAVGMTGFQARFDPIVLALRRALVAGGIGRVVGARIAIGAAAHELPDWKRSRASGGGVLLDLGSHAVDLARFLFASEVRAVVAAVVSMRTEDDTASMALTLDDGALVQVFVGLSGIQESVIEVIGESGALVADRYARTLARHPRRPPYGRRAHLARELGRLTAVPRGVRNLVAPPDDASAYRAALSVFVRAAVAGGSSPSPDIEEGWRSLSVVLAAESAAREGLRMEPEPAPA